MWDAGPVVSAPTATSGLQTGSWAAGPTFVALAIPGSWVIGALVNNVWTFSDAGDDPEMNQFLLQPFVNFNFGKGWAIASVPLITANWDAESGQQWTVPMGAGISRTTVFSDGPSSWPCTTTTTSSIPMPPRGANCGSCGSCSSRSDEAANHVPCEVAPWRTHLRTR